MNEKKNYIENSKNIKKKKIQTFEAKNLEILLSDYKITWFHKLKKEDKNKYYSIEDLKKYLIKNDILHTQKELEDLSNYRIFGYLELNTHLKKVTAGYTKSKFFLFIIVKKDHKECCLSVSKFSPTLWFRTTNKTKLKKLLDQINYVYNPHVYNINFTKCKSFFGGTMGSLEMDLVELESMMIVNNNTELLTWGSVWNDYPFRHIFNNNLSKYDKNSISVQASRQHPDFPHQVNVRTLLSKSQIRVENYNGSYVVTIWYNPIENKNIDKLNKKLKKNYPNDLPLDLLMVITSFEYYDYLSILKTKNKTPLNYFMANLLINTEQEKEELITYLENDNNDDAKFFLAKLQTKSEIKKTFIDESFEEFVLKIMSELNEKNNKLKEEVARRLQNKFKKLDINNQFVKKEIDYLVSEIVNESNF